MSVIVQYEKIHHLLRSRQQLPKSSDIVDPTPTRQFNCALLGLDPPELVAIHRAVSTLLHGRTLACRAGGKFLFAHVKMDLSMSQDHWSGSKTCF